MEVTDTEFDVLEKQILELITAIDSLRKTENDLRESLVSKVNDADTAESEKAVAQRSAAQARAEAAAASACSDHVTSALTVARSQLAAAKSQLGTVEQQCSSEEQRCIELSLQVRKKEQEVQQLRALRSEQDMLKRNYSEYEKRVNLTIEEVQSEKTSLQEELRNLERCVAGGEQLRERARLAAAAHAYKRLLAVTELKQTTEQLRKANNEIGHLKLALLEASNASNDITIGKQDRTLLEKSEFIIELRSLLEAERVGAAQLQRALCAAETVNAELKNQLVTIENRKTSALTNHITSQNTIGISSYQDNNLSLPSSNP